MKWFYKLQDYIQHSLFALVIMVLFSFVFLNVWVGALAGSMFYYGRECRDAEVINSSLFDTVKVLMPWNWDKDSLTDFVAPVIACVGAAILFKLFV